MLKENLEKLCQEFNLKMPSSEKEKSYSLSFNKEIEILLREENSSPILLKSILAPCPEENREELFLLLLRANLLGEGSRGSVIGMEEKEKFLTLSLFFPYEVDYGTFRNHFEDFVNLLLYWRKEIEKKVKGL